MLPLTINAQNYEVPNRSEELTLERFMALVKFEKTAPHKLKAIWDAETVELKKALVTSVTPEEQYAQFVPYYCGWLQCLIGCPLEELTEQDPEKITNAYYLLHKCFAKPEKTDIPTQIQHAGKVWHFPARFMRNNTVGEYAAAVQLQEMAAQNEGSYVHSLPRLCAILLRETPEMPYVKETVDKNEPIFRTMTMDKVWAVDFFLSKSVQNSKQAIQIYTLMKEAEKLTAN